MPRNTTRKIKDVPVWCIDSQYQIREGRHVTYKYISYETETTYLNGGHARFDNDIFMTKEEAEEELKISAKAYLMKSLHMAERDIEQIQRNMLEIREKLRVIEKL